MLDYINDGQPMETPIGARSTEFFNQPPSEGEKFGAMFGESSITGMLWRHEQREQASQQAQSLNVREPLLSPEEVNKQYAPMGPDGKQVPITTEPMYGRVAKLVAQSKAAELDREGVLSRAAANGDGMAHTFTLGLAAFVADPLNAATMFVPGLGEENALSALGRAGITGIAGRTGARIAAGGAAGTVAQAPLSALKYGLGREEASDYDSHSAFRDMAFSAAGGAILHAGFGALGDAWKAKGGVKTEEVPPEQKINFSEKYQQQKTDTLYHAEDLESYREKNANIIQQEKLYEPSEQRPSDNTIMSSLESIPKRLEDINIRLKDTTLPPDWRDVLENYRQKLTNVAEKYSNLKEPYQNEINLANWRGEISSAEVKTLLEADANTKDTAIRSAIAQLIGDREVNVNPIFPKDGTIKLGEMAENQRQIYREGSAPNMTSNELEKATNEVMAKKQPTKTTETKPPEVPENSEEPKSFLKRIVERVGLVGERESTAEGQQVVKTGIDSVDARQPEIDELEAKLDRTGMTNEELNEVADSSKAYNDAVTNLVQKMDALKECLARTGG